MQQQQLSSRRCSAARAGTSCPAAVRRPPHAPRSPGRDNTVCSSISSGSNSRRFSCDCAAAGPRHFTPGCWGVQAQLAARCQLASSRVQGPSRPDKDVIDVSIQLSSDQKVQLTAAIAQTSNYLELYRLVKKCGTDLDENIAAFAMLQAANLQETVQDEALVDDTESYGQAAELIDAHSSVVEMLMPCIERHVAGYPASIQLTLVSALAQLGHYSESVFSAVAHSCCELGDATGGMIQAAEQEQAESRASAPAVILEPPSSSSSPGPLLPDNPELTRQLSVVGLQLMLSSSAYALAGHYDKQLFDLIAKQVVQYLDYMADMPTLINILCAFMDVDHLSRDLLEAAGEKLAAEMSGIQPADAASVLLVYAFFRVKNPHFYERLLEVASQLDAETVDPKTAGMLYRGIKLLPDPVPIPPQLAALLDKALERFGMLELSVTSGCTNPHVLDYLEQGEGEEVETMIQQSGMEEVTARRELFIILTEVMELPAERNIPASPDGWLPVHIAVQYEGVNFCFLVMKDGTAKIKNEDMRLRGPIASEIRCMRQEGWIVLLLETQDWTDHKHRFGVEEDGDLLLDVAGLTDFLEAMMDAAVRIDVVEEAEGVE